MHSFALLVIAASAGVDFGWQPQPDGSVEYIIQIEPALLDALRSGQAISSEIAPEVRGVRRFRIQVGTSQLPREGNVPAERPLAAPPAAPMAPPMAPPMTAPMTLPPVAAPEPAGDLLRNPLLTPPPFQPPRPAPATAAPTQPQDTPPGEFMPRDLFQDSPPPGMPPRMAPPTPVDAAEGMVDPPAAPNLLPRLPSAAEWRDEQTRPANHVEPATGIGVGTAAPPVERKVGLETNGPSPRGPATPERAWLPLAVTSLFLFASIGLNVYLGWIFHGLHGRYRVALRRSAKA